MGGWEVVRTQCLAFWEVPKAETQLKDLFLSAWPWSVQLALGTGWALNKCSEKGEIGFFMTKIYLLRAFLGDTWMDRIWFSLHKLSLFFLEDSVFYFYFTLKVSKLLYLGQFSFLVLWLVLLLFLWKWNPRVYIQHGTLTLCILVWVISWVTHEDFQKLG